MTKHARESISDLQFTGSYRVPFQFSPYLRERLPVGSFVRASSGVTVPSPLILVSVSNTLYSTTSAIAEAAPAVGSRPGGSSVMPNTSASFLGCAHAGTAAVAFVYHLANLGYSHVLGEAELAVTGPGTEMVAVRAAVRVLGSLAEDQRD